MLKSRENFLGKRSKTVSRACTSFRVETKPAGLCNMMVSSWSGMNQFAIDFDMIARGWLRAEIGADFAVDCDAAGSN